MELHSRKLAQASLYIEFSFFDNTFPTICESGRRFRCPFKGVFLSSGNWNVLEDLHTKWQIFGIYCWKGVGLSQFYALRINLWFNFLVSRVNQTWWVRLTLWIHVPTSILPLPQPPPHHSHSCFFLKNKDCSYRMNNLRNFSSFSLLLVSLTKKSNRFLVLFFQEQSIIP